MNKLLNDIVGRYTLPQDVKAKGIYPYYRPIESGQDPVVKMKGRNVLMFGSNSYLGLSDDPRLKEAAIDAIRRYGTSCSGSRFLNGTLDIHLELEEKLARLVGKEEAVTYSTGFQVNLGVVSLGTRDGYIFLDAFDHASIIDGSRLSFSKVLKFGHNDMASLEDKLSRVPLDAPKLIVVDGIYSMSGDIAPLPEILDLADKFNASVMVDDAHSLGVLGDRGRGTADYFGVTERVDLIMGTFSKSFGSLGGFIAGNHVALNYIKHNSRSLIFSASMPPANVAAVSKAIDIMLEEPERIDHLWDITRHARDEFLRRGFDIGCTQSPIFPLYVRDTEKCLTAVKDDVQLPRNRNRLTVRRIGRKRRKERGLFSAENKSDQRIIRKALGFKGQIAGTARIRIRSSPLNEFVPKGICRRNLHTSLPCKHYCKRKNKEKSRKHGEHQRRKRDGGNVHVVRKKNAQRLQQLVDAFCIGSNKTGNQTNPRGILCLGIQHDGGKRSYSAKNQLYGIQNHFSLRHDTLTF